MIKTTIKVIGGIARGAKKHTICYLAGMLLLALFPVCSVLLIKNLVNHVMDLAQGGAALHQISLGGWLVVCGGITDADNKVF